MSEENKNETPGDQKEPLKCVWMTGTECTENAIGEEHKLFSKQIKVPICQNHVEEHTHIMILCNNGYDVEQVLQETPEYRKQQVLILKLAGLDISGVEI
jgi:hypothetical protein